MKNVSDKSCIEYQNTYVQQLFSEDHAVHETVWKNTLELDRPRW